MANRQANRRKNRIRRTSDFPPTRRPAADKAEVKGTVPSPVETPNGQSPEPV